MPPRRNPGRDAIRTEVEAVLMENWDKGKSPRNILEVKKKLGRTTSYSDVLPSLEPILLEHKLGNQDVHDTLKAKCFAKENKGAFRGMKLVDGEWCADPDVAAPPPAVIQSREAASPVDDDTAKQGSEGGEKLAAGESTDESKVAEDEKTRADNEKKRADDAKKLLNSVKSAYEAHEAAQAAAKEAHDNAAAARAAAEAAEAAAEESDAKVEETSAELREVLGEQLTTLN